VLSALYETRLAFRNVLRHQSRSLFALVTVTTGVAALVVSGGFIHWVFDAIKESSIRLKLGHIQISKPGFREAGAVDPFRFLIPPDSLSPGAISEINSVRAVAPRIHFSGLAAYGDSTIAFVGHALSPKDESGLPQAITLIDGSFLSQQDPEGLLLGEGLAQRLRVRVGDRLALVGSTADGGVTGVEGSVRGIFYSSLRAYDDHALRMNIELAQRMLRTNGVHEYLVMLDETDATDLVLPRVRQLLRSTLEAVPWHQRAEEYRKTVDLMSRQFVVAEVAVALIVLLAIANTMVMAVLERESEIGTALALGATRRRILGRFAIEGLVLGFVGGSAGLLIGVVVATIVSAIGIPMPPAPQMRHGYSGEILVTAAAALRVLALAVAASALAAVYPAWKASRQNIVDAIRAGH
jgi:putative ABC transport system permease protein